MWTANLFQVTTGSIGPRVNFKDLTWSISLNDIESCSIDVTKTDLPSLNLNYWLSPWWAGILVMWDGVPIFAGPIVSRPAESFNTIRVECRGIRALFERRYLIAEVSDMLDLSRSKVRFDGKDYGTMAQKAVQFGMAKPGGYVPIVFPYPELASSVLDDDHTRTVYSGYEGDSVNVHNVLSELAAKTNGPDIMFRPRLIDGNSLVWDMLHGTESDPTIPQKTSPIWDTTAVNGQVTDLDIVTTGTYQSNRMYITGDGSNEQTRMAVAMDNLSLSQGFPLLEGFKAVGSSVRDAGPALNAANAALKANKDSLVEIQLTVRADGEHRLGTFWPGDEVQLITKGWLSLKDGTHRLRLLNINGSTDGNVRMSLQTER
ncbi:minor tail protein [Arthrobacter phage Racecar]|nr:minor tail protein [Arthrobacter phage Racecar]QFG12849.1 minor tail protein [Arthrobacter phage Mimi]